MKIRDLDISASSRAGLLNAGYEEIEELKGITDEELIKIKNINENCVKEIRRALDECCGKADETEDLIDFDELSLDDDEDNNGTLVFNDEDKENLFVESLVDMTRTLIELQKEINALQQQLAGKDRDVYT